MIEIKNLKKIYNKNTILNDINLNIFDHEFIVILGPSGCGKSTFLRLISGLEQPSDGDIIFDSTSILKLTPKQRDIAMVFQDYALFPDMNVFQNIAFGLQIRKMKKAEIFNMVNDIAKKLKIDSLLKRKPHQLSGGEQQRVALARAMVKNPKIYLFDEPLSNLDVNLKDEFMDLIKNIHQETKATFIYVTHAQNEALKLADRIVVMNEGKILQVDDPFKLYENPNSIFVANFVGEPKINILDIENSDIKVGFRPESIAVIESNNVKNGLRFNAKITSTNFLGNGYILNVVFGNYKIKVFSLLKYENCCLDFFIPYNHLMFFDSNGNKLITTKDIFIKDNQFFIGG